MRDIIMVMGDTAQNASQIPSVYQPDKVNLNSVDPAISPGGTFYDPYTAIAGSGANGTVDPWKGDFSAQPDANLVSVSDRDISKFDPTPADPLTVEDIYGISGKGVQNIPVRGMSGSKERVVESIATTENERHPLVEMPTVINKEIEKIPEMEAKVEEKEFAVLEGAVKDDKTGDVLVTPIEDDRPSIEVPISQTQYQAGFKLSPSFSLRWLLELVRLLAMRGYRVVFKN